MHAKLKNFHIDVYVYYVCGTLKDKTPTILENNKYGVSFGDLSHNRSSNF